VTIFGEKLQDNEFLERSRSDFTEVISLEGQRKDINISIRIACAPA
jgi:hypothetical protein